MNDAGESEEAPATIVASGSLGANSAVAQDGARSRKTTFVIIIGGLAIGLAALGFVLLRRSAARRDEPADPRRATCARASAGGGSAVQSTDVDTRPGLPLLPERLSPPQHVLPPRRQPAGPGSVRSHGAGTSAGGVCPTCGRGYDPGVKTCPVHGDDLVPAAVYQLRVQQPLAAERGKSVPSCGGRYGGEATFCGKDGSALVLVN